MEPIRENNSEKFLAILKSAVSTFKDLSTILFSMKKLFFYAFLGTALTVLSSFTEITTNVPANSGDYSGKSVFHCLFAQTELTVFGVTIWVAEYPSWEACRKA